MSAPNENDVACSDAIAEAIRSDVRLEIGLARDRRSGGARPVVRVDYSRVVRRIDEAIAILEAEELPAEDRAQIARSILTDADR